MKRVAHILVLLVMASSLFAQSKKDAPTIKTPDLQTSDAVFFDPTRIEKEKPAYHFGVEWRVEVGYVQNNQRSKNKTYPNAYLHGGKVGVAVDFLLPYDVSLQTGVHYALAGGRNDQHFPSIGAANGEKEYLRHTVLEHNLIIPLRAYYTVKLPKKWALLFYGGPQLQIGLAQVDQVKTNVTDATLNWVAAQGMPIETYDRYKETLYRANIQLGVGGGVQWDRLRLTAGYDFGLNNLVRDKVIPDQQLWEWSWFVSFGVRIN